MYGDERAHLGTCVCRLRIGYLSVTYRFRMCVSSAFQGYRVRKDRRRYQEILKLKREERGNSTIVGNARVYLARRLLRKLHRERIQVRVVLLVICRVVLLVICRRWLVVTCFLSLYAGRRMILVNCCL